MTDRTNIRSYLKNNRWYVALGTILSVAIITDWSGVRQCFASRLSADICTIFGKSAWDWLNLFIAPAILASFGIAANQYFKQRDKQQAEREKKIAKDKEQQEVLKSYFSEMTNLLLANDWPKLDQTKADSDGEQELNYSCNNKRIVAVARAMTLAILRELDGERKGSVVKFLSESNSLKLVSLASANLEGANLFGANLSHATLSGAYLQKANLIGAYLRGTNLSGADLSGAHLSGATLSGANLIGADFSGADLSRANLFGDKLFGVHLFGDNLEGGNLEEPNLFGANLFNIKWSNDTHWPNTAAVAFANNIPEDLKKHLGITNTLPLPSTLPNTSPAPPE